MKLEPPRGRGAVWKGRMNIESRYLVAARIDGREVYSLSYSRIEARGIFRREGDLHPGKRIGETLDSNSDSPVAPERSGCLFVRGVGAFDDTVEEKDHLAYYDV